MATTSVNCTTLLSQYASNIIQGPRNHATQAFRGQEKRKATAALVFWTHLKAHDVVEENVDVEASGQLGQHLHGISHVLLEVGLHLCIRAVQPLWIVRVEQISSD